MTLQAVVFDFDGLIIDSEWVIFESACAAFAEHGHHLSVEAWATKVGTNDHHDPHWWEKLCDAAGAPGFAREHFDSAYAAQDRSNRDTLPVLPGVEDLLGALHQAGVPTGVASSSPRAWLDRHLGRLGLAERFDAIVGADLVGGVGKPAPDVYLKACAELGADPRASVALEDSAPGVSSAKAAGMSAVAVPSQITRHSDLSHADLVVDSLDGLALPTLQALVARPAAGPGSA